MIRKLFVIPALLCLCFASAARAEVGESPVVFGTTGFTVEDDVVGGTATALYNPANGHVSLDANGISIWRLESTNAQFTGTPTVLPGARWTITGTSQQADASLIGEFIGTNSIAFTSHFDNGTFSWVYDHAPGDLGQLLPAGLTTQTGAGLSFTYGTLGNPLVTVPLAGLLPVPEPSTIVLAGLAGVALVFGARRRKVA